MSAPRALPRALRRTRWPHAHHSRRAIATAPAVEHHDPDTFIPPPAPGSSLPAKTDRRQELRDAKPFSSFLTDTFDRQHDYLRISLTERCNLRCLYCMPEEGIQLSPNKDILTTAEIFYLSALFVNQGVNKIRLTGGEPTVRKDIIPLMQQLGSLRRNGLKEIALTTNGISLHRKLDEMVEAGLTGVNISLDTLDPHEFVLLTRRQGFDAVMKSINKVQDMNKLGAGIKLKVNCVAMRGLNDHQILPFVEMTRDQDIEVRFIEYMPFGGNKWSEKKMLPYSEMLDLIRTKYPISRLKGAKNDTSKTWQVPGFKGKVGFITSMTHNFCGTCNRLRITSDGNLKVCLHGNTEVSLRDLLRKDHHGEPMDEAAFEAIRQIELDRRKQDSLRLDGEGWISKERELLEVIGAAVKRKKAAHAGMGQLENMENRPMILIGEMQRTGRAPPITRAKTNKSSTPAWSKVPLHLLQPLGAVAQARHYSTGQSDSNNKSHLPSDTARSPADAAPSQTPSFFTFQSLSSLFQQPSSGRYSKPRERDQPKPEAPGPDVVGKDLLLPQQNDEGISPRTPPNQTPDINEGAGSPQKEKPVRPRKQKSTRTVPADAQHAKPESVSPIYPSTGAPEGFKIRKFMQLEPADMKSDDTRESSPDTPGARAIRRPNPFKTQRSMQKLAEPSEHGKQAGPAKPWGLSQEEQISVDPTSVAKQASHSRRSLIPEREQAFASGFIRTPTTQSPDPEPSQEAASDLVRKPVVTKPSPNSQPQRAASDSGQTAGDQSQKSLTHVNSSGEAHMVDVGGKESTKRVAIATSRVAFYHPDTYNLIIENKNKKGDVLGVARIAGIMAAKRTSDLIPLCHPISLSKVLVDVVVRPPVGRNIYGIAEIFVQVECTGPTGVEMEALTAASATALTIYDMCKAVDKNMTIVQTNLVYKSGGRSGVFANEGWAKRQGTEWFLEKALQVPLCLAQGEETTTETTESKTPNGRKREGVAKAKKADGTESTVPSI